MPMGHVEVEYVINVVRLGAADSRSQEQEHAVQGGWSSLSE